MSDKTVASAAQCPGCLGNSTKLHVIKNSYPIHRCSDCELLFVHPQPAKEELGKLYSASYFSRGDKYVNAWDPKHDPNWLNDQCKVELVKRWCSSGTLLDVGCASEGFLRWQKSMALRSRESRSASMPPNRRAPDCISRLPIATSTQLNSRPRATM